jgi:hypothetical protein
LRDHIVYNRDLTRQIGYFTQRAHKLLRQVSHVSPRQSSNQSE